MRKSATIRTSATPKVGMLLLAGALLLGACGGSDGPAGERGSQDRTAYAFEVTTFAGTRFDVSDNGGRPVVLNFWESW